MVKSIILMRHAERDDRAQEKAGIDWISTAPRPQDPILSPYGREQAMNVGDQLKAAGVTKILSSPMIRTVITSDIVATQLGLGANSVCVEMSMVEESKSFRGKTAAEPRPNWSPLILPAFDLAAHSSRINLDYSSIMMVTHAQDESMPNTVREVHATLTDRDAITKDRCLEAFRKIVTSDELKDDVVLCVGHGATVKAYALAMEAGLPEEMKIRGERTVSCWAKFEAIDPLNPLGPWRSVQEEWATGDFKRIAVEAAEDMGFSADGLISRVTSDLGDSGKLCRD
ncbi:histidine phosphatase superfamily [Ochromonadaceae sp. CCMP2298]|nr:histidine phosphatase superfamily [Ochromonadaceae sp. CCMP2298]